MSTPVKFAHLRIDEQNDFVDGSLAVKDSLAAIIAGNAINTNPKFTATFSTQDWHPQNHISFVDNNPGADLFSVKRITLDDGEETDQVMWPTHCVQGSKGAEFHPAKVVNPNIPHTVIRKGTNPHADSYSGYGCARQGKDEKTTLDAELKAAGIMHVVVTGIAEDFCCALTAKDAVKRGYKVCFPLWAVRGVAPESCAKECAEMTAMGVELVNTPEELEAWFAGC